MGLYDRDYMRRRQGEKDSYWDWLHGSGSSGRGLEPSEPAWRSYQRAPAQQSLWARPVSIRWVTLIVLVIVALALPHLTIAGRHWHIWFLP